MDSYVIKKPSNIYEIKEQKLDMLIDRLNISMKNIIEKYNVRLFTATNSYILNNPKMLYLSKYETLKNIYQRLNKEIEIIITNNKTKMFKIENSYILNNPSVLYKYKEQNLINLISKLEVLNPLNTLKRGYAIIKKDNVVINDIKNIALNDEVNIQIKNGNIITKVMKVSEENGEQ